MSEVLPFCIPQKRRMRLSGVPVKLEAAIAVSQYVSLRPGPAETPSQFVTRIVRAYKQEAGE